MDSGLPIIFCVLTCDTLETSHRPGAGLKGREQRIRRRGSPPSKWRKLSRKLRASHAKACVCRKAAAASKRCLSAPNPRVLPMQIAVPVGHEPAGFHQAGSEILEKRKGRGQRNARIREQNFLRAAAKGTSPTPWNAIIVKPRRQTGGSKRLAGPSDRAILRLAIHEMNGTGQRRLESVLKRSCGIGLRSFPRKIPGRL